MKISWEELGTAINAHTKEPSYQLLHIGFFPNSGDGFMHYSRWLIEKAIYHENLFIIQVGWRATFEPLSNKWVLKRPSPQTKRSSFEKDTTGHEPLLIQTNEGQMIRISCQVWGIFSQREINPAQSVSFPDIPLDPTQQATVIDGYFAETGLFIIPPGPYSLSKKDILQKQ